MRQNTITILLAAIAVLLGLNLVVRGSPTAEGQTASTLQRELAPVGIAVTQVGESTNLAIFRLWSDGAVDRTTIRYETQGGCALDQICPADPVLPSYCTADIDRSGAVDAPDFLQVLSQWGPCE